MMPHACKNPLGRQEPTKHRRHTVELIQPVNKMLNFLTKGEDVKNGYFLSDVLSKVCFVFGTQEVYYDYLQKSRDLTNRTQKEIAEEQRHLIERNPNLGVRYSDFDNLISDGKIKESTYRPLTTLLSCAAAFHSLSAISSFEIADELRSRGIIDNQIHHKLMSAVSTAMEMRLRVYLQAGKQRNTVKITELEEHVGRDRLMNCHLALHTWRKRGFEYIYGSLESVPSFSEEFTEGYRILQDYFSENDENTVLQLFSEYRKATRSDVASILRTVRRFRNSEITALESRALLRMQFMFLINSLIPVFAEEFICRPPISSLESQNWEWLSGIVWRYCDNEDMRWRYHVFSSKVNRRERKFENVRKDDREAVRLQVATLQREVSTGISHSISRFPNFFEDLVKAMSREECLKHLDELLNDAKYYETRCWIRIGICKTLVKKGRKEQAKYKLVVLKANISRNARRLGLFLFHNLLSKIEELECEAYNRTDDLCFIRIVKKIQLLNSKRLQAS